MKKYLKGFILFIFGLLLLYAFCRFPAPKERILNIQNYLITSAGIISALVIAFLSAKFFSLKSERDNRQIEIDTLSKRLTAFRQLLYFVKESRDFWVEFSQIQQFKREYPALDYTRLRDVRDELTRKFYKEDESISEATVRIYTAIELLYGAKEEVIHWAYENPKLRYTMADLWNYHEPCNDLWYFLKGRFGKHGFGIFHDEGLSQIFEPRFRELLALADIKLKGKDFHREVIGDLGAEFYENVIPQLGSLIKANTGIPKNLVKTCVSLVLIMVLGVIFPIILQSLSVPENINTILSLIFVGLTTLSLIYFLIEFIGFMNDELHPNKKSPD